VRFHESSRSRTSITCGGGATAAEKKLHMKDLPPAVQKTVQEQTKGAEIKGLSKETEEAPLITKRATPARTERSTKCW
jgi:hypothetical protein